MAGVRPRSRPWVSRFAGRIDDPVVRLRFLQAVAPPPELAPPQRVRRLIGLVLPPSVMVTLAALLLVQAGGRVQANPAPAASPVPQVITKTFPAPTGQPAEVWQVEKSGSSETYSNGLRIDDRMTVSNHPRSYLVFPADRPGQVAGARRSEPVGIVFHTTESRQAPFEAGQNGVLKKIGESLLEYVRRRRSYHFLIDRFGRVYRVVAETDAANHAGYSVWSDGRWRYVNLNESFLGVSVEAQTRPGQVEAEMSPAQLRSAAMLTEMLRSKYHIPADHCVTHAQVSVNPSNMQVGYHTDWASSFPFEQLGLPNNYAQPLPALVAFGFEYNPEFLHWVGDRIGVGVRQAEERLAEEAADSGLSLRTYRASLQKRYREQLEQVRRGATARSEESE